MGGVEEIQAVVPGSAGTCLAEATQARAPFKKCAGNWGREQEASLLLGASFCWRLLRLEARELSVGAWPSETTFHGMHGSHIDRCLRPLLPLPSMLGVPCHPVHLSQRPRLLLITSSRARFVERRKTSWSSAMAASAEAWSAAEAEPAEASRLLRR